MGELFWRVKKNLPLALLFLIPTGIIFIWAGVMAESNLMEMICRAVFMGIGMLVMLLESERIGFIRRKERGSAFYRSMPEGVKKEKRRWMALDIFILAVLAVWYVLYHFLLAPLFDAGRADGLFLLLLVYAVLFRLLSGIRGASYWITGPCAILTGGLPFAPVPWGILVAVLLFLVIGEVWFYKSLERRWMAEV